jgi:hypothetical protein
MLFRQSTLEGIRAGTFTLAFRRWRRPTVRAGGTLLTAAGQLHIGAITTVAPDAITAAEARRAGYASREALLADLNRRSESAIHRVELGALTADPRIALRAQAAIGADELHVLREKLRRLDAHAADGPWTRRTLDIVRQHPGVRAGDLCAMAGMDKLPFKVNVRKLKALGLTESLEVGYRLSPRGVALLESLRGIALS